MSVTNVLSLLCGVALFLFGMSLMGDGLKKVAGNSLELILYKVSGTPLKGLLLGAGVTAVIQSSSATSVMVVGFVNSGIMKLKQAISIIMGAIIGTSVTGWIICLSSIEGTGWVSLLSTSNISAVVAIIGIILRMFCKDQTKHHIGDILMGFAILMTGMHSMSSAVEPLRESPVFINMITTFSNPFAGILVGALFTAVLQSASAACGILQALSATGVITFAIAYPMLLGIGIGAAVPVLLSGMGAKVDGKRSAYAYLIISVLGAVICGVAFYAVNAFAHFGFMNSVVNTVDIAAVNTIFRTVSTFALLPFTGAIEKWLDKIVKESAQEKAANEDFDRLDERFLQHPALAVEACRQTANAMANKSRQNITDALALIDNYSDAGFNFVTELEDYVDRYEDKLGNYLLKVTGAELTQKQSEEVSEFLHVITDLERISDHSLNIAESAREIHTKKIVFSDQAKSEIDTLIAALNEILEIAFTGFINDDDSNQYSVEPLEEVIDNITGEMKLRHVDRMKQGICSLNQGFVFNDIINNCERVADHCSNIAIAMIELKEKDEFQAHDYSENIKNMHNRFFDEKLDMYTVKYKI